MRPPFIDDLARVVDRDLRALHAEVEAYPDDATLWALRPGILNSGGTLVLHLCGNLQHFVGAVLGGSGYVRDRAAEFADRDLTRETLLDRVEVARGAVRLALEGMDESALAAPFPHPAPESLGEAPTTGLMLLHLSGHLMYHLGQVNYHRRLSVGGGARG